MEHMHRALALARQALQHSEVPVGAVLVHNNQIICEVHNLCLKNNNSLNHAEMLALSQGISFLKTPYLSDCTLFVTLEPCPMCAASIAQVRLGKLVFGAYDPKSGGVDHGPMIFKHSHYKPEIIGGVLEATCSQLLKDFFEKKR